MRAAGVCRGARAAGETGWADGTGAAPAAGPSSSSADPLFCTVSHQVEARAALGDAPAAAAALAALAAADPELAASPEGAALRALVGAAARR